MGKRGPQPGAKAAKAKAAAVATGQASKEVGKAASAALTAADAPLDDTPPVPPVAPPVDAEPQAVPMSATDRENPEKLTGDMLRTLAHRRGLARSAVDLMDDAKIRRELRVLAYRQYEMA